MTRKVALLAAGLLFLAAAVPAIAATTVKISGNTAAAENDLGWMFNRDAGTSSPFEFTTDEASIGAGSLYVQPIGANPSDKFIGELFLLTELGDIDSISYDFLMGAGTTAGEYEHFYASVYINFASSSPTKFYDCRYAVIPTTGSTSAWTTVVFDPTAIYPVATRPDSPVQPCPASPADMGADAVLRVISFNVGDTSVNDEGIDGYLDNVVVDLADDTTIYDLDPAAETTDDCKDGGWEDFGFANQGLCLQFVNTGRDSR